MFNADASDGALFGTVLHLSHASGGASLASRTSLSTAWSAAFVAEKATKEVTLDSSGVAKRSVHVDTEEGYRRLTFLWSEMQVADAGALNVSLVVSVVGGLLRHRLGFYSTSRQLGLWEWSLFPGGAMLLPEGSATFENAGFGVVHAPPRSFQGVYPQKTMQYMAAIGPSNFGGVYVAAHDALASSKNLGLSVSDDGGRFFISATPPGAGQPLDGGETHFDVVMAVFDGGWWDAAQLYRSWALAEASWTTQGPMLQRDDVPAWLYGITTWVNSHWQGMDIFNVSGGDPVVVRQRVAAIVERFGLAPSSLALHWYEWDTLGYQLGSNYSVCESEVTCGFDTHYPEYFPVREGFEENMKAMQELGVRVCPYINGRIFDKGTQTWTKDSAEDWASKNAAPALGTPDLSTYEEQYGSKAKFAVMCPHTAYWQDTIADVVGQLTGTYGTDGVYIDQIAAAGPKSCFDKSHNHSLGGGHHWVSGYATMLRKARAQAGNDKVILTESNSEPFMGGLNLFLTLVGFLSGDLPSTPEPTTGSIIVPAFQSIYGGYVLPVGAEFYQPDFDDPDVFAAKVAVMYIFGAQMGWFSLGGRDNEHPGMGIFELLMDPKYDAEILYLRRLSEAKLVAAEWFNHGRTMRPVDFDVNASSDAVRVYPQHHRSHREGAKVGVAFGALMSSAWLAADGRSLLVTATAVRRDVAVHAQARLDVRRYGLPADKRYEVERLPVDGAAVSSLGVFDGGAVDLDLALAARDVVLLRVAAVDASSIV